MLFKSKGKIDKSVILLLHGGGLSDWSLENVANLFIDDYYVITTIIDGHGDDACNEFISIEDCANKIIEYIKTNFGSSIHAICGLSIGAQIICEILAKEKDIVKYAVIESALVYPIKMATALTVPTYHLAYGLIKRKWFAKLQAETLCVPDNLFEIYYNDSLKITKQNLINITKSNGNYNLKPSIVDTSAKVLVIVGEKEIKVMKKSAKLIHQTINDSSLLIVPKLKHGEFSLTNYIEYLKVVKGLFAQ